MSLEERWLAFALRSAQSVGVVAEGADAGTFLSVAFHIVGKVQGAIHAHVPAKLATAAQARQFAESLTHEAKEEGLALRTTWCAVTHGPHVGERANGLVFALEPLSLPKELERLRIAQTIEAAKSLSEDSVIAITQELQHIYELASTHADGLKSVASQFSDSSSGAHGATLASTFEALSSQMRSFGEEMLDRTTRQARDIEQARIWTNDIVKLGQAIAAIASNARILTFNARLESARIGEAGKGFAVIAASIQDLATQVRQTNQAVSRLAQNLATVLPKLGIDAAATSKVASSSVGQLEDQLVDLQKRLADVRAESWEAVVNSSSRAEELQGKANSVIHHLQFQDRTSQMLAEAITQASAVMAVAGLKEESARVDATHHVGELGRVPKSSAVQHGDAIELF
jgi:hypothetical protein